MLMRNDLYKQNKKNTLPFPVFLQIHYFGATERPDQPGAQVRGDGQKRGHRDQRRSKNESGAKEQDQQKPAADLPMADMGQAAHPVTP